MNSISKIWFGFSLINLGLAVLFGTCLNPAAALPNGIFGIICAILGVFFL